MPIRTWPAPIWMFGAAIRMGLGSVPAARVRFWRAGVVRKGDQAAPLLLPPTPISHATDAARHIYNSPLGSWRADNHRLIEDSCTGAQIRLGAYDLRILLRLAGWEPWTCAVLAGLVTRAHADALDEADLRTVPDALDVAADHRRDTAANCGEGEAAPGGSALPVSGVWTPPTPTTGWPPTRGATSDLENRYRPLTARSELHLHLPRRHRRGGRGDRRRAEPAA